MFFYTQESVVTSDGEFPPVACRPPKKKARKNMVSILHFAYCFDLLNPFVYFEGHHIADRAIFLVSRLMESTMRNHKRLGKNDFNIIISGSIQNEPEESQNAYSKTVFSAYIYIYIYIQMTLFS